MISTKEPTFFGILSRASPLGQAVRIRNVTLPANAQIRALKAYGG